MNLVFVCIHNLDPDVNTLTFRYAVGGHPGGAACATVEALNVTDEAAPQQWRLSMLI